MTKPKDEGKLKKLLAKASQTGSKIATKKVNGWYVFSTNQANIDQALKKSGKSLDDEGSFNRAIKALPSNALIKTYVSGKGLTNIVKSAAASTSGLGANGAGALGNLADRVRTHAVTDFIDPVWWPAFNVADSCIFIAVFSFIVHSLRKRKEATL